MSKYPFKSFAEIPMDNSGLHYPSLKDVNIYLPSFAQYADYHQLPEKMKRTPVVTTINGFTLLSRLEFRLSILMLADGKRLNHI